MGYGPKFDRLRYFNTIIIEKEVFSCFNMRKYLFEECHRIISCHLLYFLTQSSLSGDDLSLENFFLKENTQSLLEF